MKKNTRISLCDTQKTHLFVMELNIILMHFRYFYKNKYSFHYIANRISFKANNFFSIYREI